MAVIRMLNHTKRTFEEVLRIAFSKAPTPEEYRYTDDATKSQISIYKQSPRQVEKYPAIRVMAEAGDAKLTSLDEEEVFIKRDADGVEESIHVSGGITLTVRLIVSAQTSDDLEMLMDLLVVYIRHVYRGAIYSRNVNYKEISFESEGTEDAPDGTTLFTSGITVNCYVEYDADLPLGEIITKDSVVITATGPNDVVISTTGGAI